MKLKDFYAKVIEFGIKADPRGVAEVKGDLADAKKTYSELKGIKKELFDVGTLENPYADTRILHGDPNMNVKRVMVGIDVEGPELLLADRLREKKKGVDLAIGHHPDGLALARLADVMGMQAAIMAKYGVPINVAEDITNGRLKDIDRRLLPGNHRRNVDIAKALDVPYMCMHTPADNHVTTFLQNMFDTRKPKKVKDVIDMLYELDEYKTNGKEGCPVSVFAGSEDRTAGKIFVDMTGGTEGSQKAPEKLAAAGVGTIVGMHMTDEHRKEAEKHHLNVVVAGHISSDSLGINLLLDNICRIEKIDIVPVSGFIRVDRTSAKKSASGKNAPKK